MVCAIFSEALRTLLQTIPRDLAQVNRGSCEPPYEIKFEFEFVRGVICPKKSFGVHQNLFFRQMILPYELKSEFEFVREPPRYELGFFRGV